MSEKNRRYEVSVAESNKKSKRRVDAFKVRKSGNSSVVTVPDSIKEELCVHDGDQVQYVTIKDEQGESVVVLKKLEQNSESNDDIDEEIEDIFAQTMEKYDDVITALAEL